MKIYPESELNNTIKWRYLTEFIDHNFKGLIQIITSKRRTDLTTW